MTDDNSPTEFIKQKEILIISDFEGTTPTTQFNKFKEYCTATEDSKRVIYLGDVFDNTAQFGKNCTGTECKDPDDNTGNCANDKNYCSLQTIKLLADNYERCRYVVGNRDINKIKVLPFFSFADKEKWWTKGEDYHTIVATLLEKTATGGDPWLFKTVHYFKPFWAKNNPNYNKQWDDDVGAKPDVYDRFEQIFGEDPKLGTMSALVSLKCLPDELILHSNGTYTDINDFYEKVNKVKVATDVVWKKRVRAALTITVFMRMLDKDLWKSGKPMKGKSVGEFGALDGYLYHYLMNAKPAYYGINNNNLYLFAHGGINTDFVKNEEGLKEINEISAKDENSWNTTEFKDKPASAEAAEKKGGAGGDEASNLIIKSIYNYNTKFFTILETFFNAEPLDQFEGQIKSMLSLLKLSAGFIRVPNQERDPSDQALDEFKGEFAKIYNMYGHSSASSGYSFGKTRSKTDGKIIGNDTYYLSTDFSTTLFKSGIYCDQSTDDYNKIYLICVLDTKGEKTKLTIDGTIIVAKGKPYAFTGYTPNTLKELDDKIKEATTQTIFVPEKANLQEKEKITIQFDGGVNILDIIDKADIVNDSIKCKLNGIAKVENENYYVYSNVFGSGKFSMVLMPYTKEEQGGKFKRTKKRNEYRRIKKTRRTK